MSQLTINKPAGLVVQPNSFTAPDGSFERLHNMIPSRDVMALKRRGFKGLVSTITDATALTEYLGTLFVASRSQLGRINTSSGAVTYLTDASSLFVINPRSKPRFAQSQGNLYAASASGVLKVESTTASIMKAGIPRGLDLSVSLSGPIGSAIFEPDGQVAYRIVFGRLDANSNKVVGAPSELTVSTNLMIDAVANASATTTVVVTKANHGLTLNDDIVVKEATDAHANGTWQVTTVTDANTFEFTTTSAVTLSNGPIQYGVFRKPTLNFSIPSDALSTEYFYQVFRSSQSGGDDVLPDEDLKLIYEANLTSTNVSNKYVTFDDTVSEIFTGAYLYTNANTGEGILQANDQPPFARDVTSFKEMVFYGNTQTKYSLNLNLLSVTGLSSYTITVTAGGVARTYTGAGSEDPSTRQYQVHSGGTTAANIDATAKSLCKMINRDATTVSGQAGSQIYAYYVSSVSAVPGMMVFNSKSFATNFSLTVSNSAISKNFTPELPTSGTTVAGSNAESPNAVYVSKVGQGEAVPAVNNLFVGNKSADILRLAPLRDTLLVIKEDGVFAIRGTSPSSLTVQPLDTTVFCKAADSVVVLDNECYFVSNQGVVAASETSVRVVSRDIEPLLTSVIGNTYFSQLTTAASYESERLYVLTTIEPNTVPETLSQTVLSASITSNVVTLVMDSDVSSSQAQESDTIILSGFISGLSVLNGNYIITDITGPNIQFTLINQNVNSTAGAGSESVSVIRQNACYVYNTTTQGWATWSTFFRDALVYSNDDKLYMLTKEGAVKQERKNQNKLDYTEDEYSLTIGTVASDMLSATASAVGTTIEVGDLFLIDGTATKIRSIVSLGGTQVYYFDSVVSFTDGATGTLYKYIQSELITAPLTGGDVTVWKQFSEFSAMCRTSSCSKLDVAFTSNLTGASDTTSWSSNQVNDGWGNLPWGNFPWGVDEGLNLVLTTESSTPIRTIVPRSCQRALWIQARLTHKQAGEAFDLQSFSYKARSYSSRTAR